MFYLACFMDVNKDTCFELEKETIFKKCKIHCTKNHVFFSKCSKKIIFPKNRTGIWYFLYYQERWFLFLENMNLFFRQKTKDDYSQKNYMEIWYFLQMFWKNGLSKKIAMEYDLSFVIWKDGIFLSENIFFLWTENERWSFSRNTWKYDIFCIYV